MLQKFLSLFCLLVYSKQLDEMWRDVRWITNALQYARYKQSLGWVPITWLVDVSVEPLVQKNDSTSSNTDYVPTPSPSPEMRRRKGTIGKCNGFSIAVIYLAFKKYVCAHLHLI